MSEIKIKTTLGFVMDAVEQKSVAETNASRKLHDLKKSTTASFTQEELTYKVASLIDEVSDGFAIPKINLNEMRKTDLYLNLKKIEKVLWWMEVLQTDEDMSHFLSALYQMLGEKESESEKLKEKQKQLSKECNLLNGAIRSALEKLLGKENKE